MDGLDFMTTLIGYGVVKNATLRIDGKPNHFGYKSTKDFSAWINGFKGADPRTIDGIIRFTKQTGGGGFTIVKGEATPIAPVGGPRTGDRRRSFSVTLRSDVDEWLGSQSNMAEVVRGAIDRAYEDGRRVGGDRESEGDRSGNSQV